MVQSALVPFFAQALNELSNPAASSAGHFNRSGGLEPLGGASGLSPSCCLAHFKRSHHSEGLSKEVIELIRKSWWASSESAYSSARRQWDSWCLRWGIERHSGDFADPVSGRETVPHYKHTQINNFNDTHEG